MKSEFNKIVNDFDSRINETALVQLFVDANKISVRKNSLIKSILAQDNKEISSLKNLLSKSIKSKTLSDFVNIFELLIPESDKKINGAFFTPKIITEFIVRQTISNTAQTICDPSCGCGAFLIAAASFFSKKFKKNILQSIRENLYGVDIADYSIRRAKILLSLLALKNGEDEESIKFNIKTADSLTIDWQKLFPKIISSGGFDVVIGNPPYVKFQDLDKELRIQLYNECRTLKSGNYNLYFAFFELGIDILKEKGVLGYITPNNYFTSLAGIHLREYLSLNRFISKIVDFNHFKLFKAQTYTCVTFLEKKGKKNYFYHERIEDRSLLNSLYKLNCSKVFYDNLNNKKWRLLREIDQKNIEIIESIGQKLGDIADIRVGIATCKDSVYFIDGSTYDGEFYHKHYKGEIYSIEKDITRSIAKISDFKTQADLEKNKRRIIFPYKKINGRAEIIKENELKKLYPNCYEYFLAARNELSTRDKGKVRYPEWYSYARTQGLTFFGKKLLTPTFSAQPRFLIENDEEALFCNGYAMYLLDKPDLFSEQEVQLDINILAKILNSKVMGYYVKQTSVSIEGGYPCYQKNFIELFGIPKFTAKEINFLKKETNKRKFDDFLVKKYGINSKA